MILPRLAGAIFIQAISFLGPLAGAWAGVISGELAGLVAPLVWFSAGVPLSYRALDRRAGSRSAAGRRKMLRPVRL